VKDASQIARAVRCELQSAISCRQGKRNRQDDMAQQEQYSTLEKELIQALLDSPADGCNQGFVGNCPSPSDLRRFEAGKYGHNQEERDALMSHLAVCDRCVDSMMQLKRRRLWRTRAALVLACAAAILVAVWTSSQHPAATSSVAIIDLRLSSPTRGTENAIGAVAARVHRHTQRLQVILPPGSEGSYEFELLNYERSTAVLRGTAQTTVEKDQVILNLTANLVRLTPGKYSFALRHGDSPWEYYSVTIE
jgi:hypothetical protein